MTHQPRARVTCLRSCVLTQRVTIWVSPELGSNQFCFPFVLHQIVSWCACARCCLGVSLLVPGGPWAGNKFIFPWTVDIITTQTDTCKDSQAKVQVLEKYDPLSHPGRRVFFILRATLLTLYSSVMQSESTLSLWSSFSSDVSVVWF